MDEMNGEMAIDVKLTLLWKNLAPYRNAFDLESKPYELSRNLHIPGPLISTIANWLSD